MRWFKVYDKSYGDSDDFDFGFQHERALFQTDDDGWRDIPMFGVPAVNGDGRHNAEDFV